jgi:RHS repeat-associated protein
VHTAAGDISYTYDGDGSQLVRRDPGSMTLFLPGEELTRDNSSGAIAGTRYYTYNGTVIAERLGNANPVYLVTDPNGTTFTAVPTTIAGTGAPVRRHQDPYGNPLGQTTGGAWPDQHGFLNKPQDAATGLVDVGARKYDPTTGQFLSVDPVLDPANPQQDNGYAYADNNPITKSDPSGLCNDICNGTSPQADPNKNSSHIQAGGKPTSEIPDPPGGGGAGTIQITSHVSIDTGAQNASKLISGFNAYAASINYRDGAYGSDEYLHSASEMFAWASYCGDAGVKLCGAWL